MTSSRSLNPLRAITGWLRRVTRRAAALRQPRALEREMDDEMHLHLELEAEELMRTRGFSAAEARRRAMLAFGGVERYKEEESDLRRARWLEDFAADLRYAARTLRSAPAFTIAVALTLALGIGATTAIFSIVRTVLLEPLPFADPERTAVIWSSWKDYPRTWVSFDEYELWRDQTHTFDDVALFMDYSTSVTGAGEPERVRAAQVSFDIFRALRDSPALGRPFLPSEDVPGGPSVAIIGHSLWERRFAGDPSIIGRQIELAGAPFTVVGVLPRDFRLPLDFGANGPTEVLTPLAATAEQYGAIPGPAIEHGGGSHTFYAVAHLASGVTVQQANRTLRGITDRLTAEGVYPLSWHFQATAVSLRDQISGPLRPALVVLLGAVVLVLLIACANAAGLLLVRAERRRRETSLRAVLGAGRMRLARQFLAEGLVLALLGGGLAIGIAALGVAATRAWAPATLPLVHGATLDARVLAFGLVVTLATVLVFALTPALVATRVSLTEAMKDGGRGATTGRARLRLRQLLVIAEVALAVVLIVGAGLMIRTVQRMLAIDPGFDSDHVLTLEISVPSSRYPDSARVAAFVDALRRRVAELPGVRAAGATRLVPLESEIGDWSMVIDGYTPPPGEGAPGDWQVVTPGYFEALGLRLVRGRVLDDRDGAGTPLVLVVNRQFAEKYFAGRDPIGGRVRLGSATREPMRIVGVVENIQHNALTAQVKPMFYAEHAQFAEEVGFAPRTMSLIIKTAGDPMRILPAVRSTLRTMDSEIPIAKVRTMDDIVRGSVARQRFSMLVLDAFAALALALAVVGIYGVVAQVVAARTQELGVRSALGATPRALVALSLRDGVRQTLVGLALGALGALVLSRAMTGLLYGVAPTDPTTFTLAMVVTALAATVACWIPARRAARVDPVEALR